MSPTSCASEAGSDSPPLEGEVTPTPNTNTGMIHREIVQDRRSGCMAAADRAFWVGGRPPGHLIIRPGHADREDPLVAAEPYEPGCVSRAGQIASQGAS